MNADAPASRPPVMTFPGLDLAASILDDVEAVWVANNNRLAILTKPQDVEDEDGGKRGWGLTLDHPDVRNLADLVTSLKALETQAGKNLERHLKAHPLHDWQRDTVGVGARQLARLVAAIGDPYWNDLHDRPRTVSELWAYCGFKPGQRRRRGVKSNWSADAKKRAYLIAVSCIKSRNSPYRGAYDRRREHTAVSHPDWTAGHSHNDALRYAAKMMLKDLWREARDIHEEMNMVEAAA
jgi:hypothetical protein